LGGARQRFYWNAICDEETTVRGVSGRIIWLIAIVALASPSVCQEATVAELLASSNGAEIFDLAPVSGLSLVSRDGAGNDTSDLSPLWPRPYAYGGFDVNRGGGYSPANGEVGAGLETDSRHFLLLAETFAQNAHKVYTGTGAEFHLQLRSFVRSGSGWYLGGGEQWSELSTIGYAKEAWRPSFGGGKDLLREDFSMRAQVMYILPGADHLNALHGPEFSLWLPSPATHSHFFWRETVGIYQFHQTAVPGNPGTSNWYSATFASFDALYRF
jgi:hypothetical protein